jgi:hypothetical protein
MTAKTNSSISNRLRLVKPALTPLAVVIVIALIALTALAWRIKTGSTAKRTTSVAMRENTQPKPKPGKIDYIGRPLVWPSLREPFRVMALRLEKPGTERIIFIGSLSRLKSNQSASLPVRVILEQPNRLRLEEGNRVTIFNGSSLTKVGSELTDDDADEVESLLLDFPERLFVGQVTGNPMFQLGSRFRMDDGKARDYKGPYYDVFEMTERLHLSANLASLNSRELTTKRYFINSDTHLIERVVYTRRRGNRIANVEVKLEDWRTVTQQRVPFSITRLEEGRPAMQLKVNTAALARRANDGLFPVGQAN